MNRIVIVKGRERIFRGVLEKFEDLPLEKQENFKLIKQAIQEELNCELDMFVFGSFNHGYWDENSDYDVSVVGHDFIMLDSIIKEKTNLKVNVFFTENKLGNVMIP